MNLTPAILFMLILAFIGWMIHNPIMAVSAGLLVIIFAVLDEDQP